MPERLFAMSDFENSPELRAAQEQSQIKKMPLTTVPEIMEVFRMLPGVLEGNRTWASLYAEGTLGLTLETLRQVDRGEVEAVDIEVNHLRQQIAANAR